MESQSDQQLWPRVGDFLRAWMGWFVVALGLLAFFLWSYGDALGGFFFLDDYWELALTHKMVIESPADLWQLFRPFQGFLLYRPLSTFAFYYTLREVFGHDPFSYHAVMMAFHVVNGLLVYALARRLFRSTRAGIATAFVYALAPGHAIAMYWMALFTMTGTAFFYFLGLWLWFVYQGRWRTPLTLAVLAAAILASEHAVSFPLVLTAGSLLLDRRRDWQRILREQSPFYVVTAVYVTVKVVYLAMLAEHRPEAYSLSLQPQVFLGNLGHYLGFATNLFFDEHRSENAAVALGALVVAAAALGTGRVVAGRKISRPLRVAVFGLDLFVVALGPIVFLADHLASYYVGIAGCGLALALVGVCAKVFEKGVSYSRSAWLCAALLAIHVVSAEPAIKRTIDFGIYNGGSEPALGWLYTIWFRSSHGEPVTHVSIPKNQVTEQLVQLDAYRVFLCDGPIVEFQSPDQNPYAGGRLVLDRAWAPPQHRRWDRSWNWLNYACKK